MQGTPCKLIPSKRHKTLDSMTRHLEQLLELDRLIRSSNRHTAVTLATSLEVSERTIRNDLDFLRDRYHAPNDLLLGCK